MRRTLNTLAVVLALALLLGTFAGCKTTTPAGSTQTDSGNASGGTAGMTTENGEKDTLTVLSAESFTGSWDPTGHTILANLHVEWIVFDRLVEMNYETGEVVPRLATEWRYLDDGITLEVKLREGVKFHDGTSLDAEDVKMTIERFTDQSRVASAWWGEPINCTVVNDLTVQMIPSSGNPYAPLVNNLCFTPIMSADDIKNEERLMNDLNGTGPYEFVKFENEQCDFIANQNYWDTEGIPKIPNLAFRYVADPATRLAALQTGEADIIERVEAEQVAQIEADANVDYMTLVSIEQKNLVFKWQMEPMNQQLVRQAIAYAIDRETIVNDIMGGYASLADCFVSPVSWGYASAKGYPTYDPEKAKALLAEAGYPGGEGLPELTYFTSVGFYPKTKEYGEFIVSNLAAVGINCKLEPMETASWLDGLYQPTSGFMCDTGWMPPGVEPDLVIGAFYRTPGQVSFCDDAELNQVLVNEAQMTDLDERAAYLKDVVFPMLSEKVPHLPLFNTVLIYAMGADVKGFSPSPTSAMPFNTVYFE